ncbi:hypothetical protein AUCHE_01_01930 [Austwickia chelonae NBRC 105200]|uniref:Tail specific protease domain-containing protein n=2 Tax=Austwickia TaxID=1184606 RepID=K6UKR5_9MICO|nr:hypothetical protein AUCHE_01_01930 [Austwickia chelonae NBRC 105200]
MAMAAIVAGGVLVWRWGPRYGIYLFPPSPAAYAEQAITKMGQGYFAEGDVWTEARAQALRKASVANSYEGTLPALKDALAVAGGPSSQLVEKKEKGKGKGQLPLPGLGTKARITTITVPKIESRDDDYLEKYARSMSKGIHSAKSGTCGWIVDLRGNAGGDALAMLSGLSPLLTDGVVAGWEKRNGKTGEVVISESKVKVGKRSLETDHGGKVGGQVAILQDGRTSHSAELVTIAFRGQPGVRSFGMPTAGNSAVRQSVPLYDGRILQLTVGVDTDRSGVRYGGPVEPQEKAADALSAATKWLATSCK